MVTVTIREHPVIRSLRAPVHAPPLRLLPPVPSLRFRRLLLLLIVVLLVVVVVAAAIPPGARELRQLGPEAVAHLE
jgi:hypothetical protein